MTKSIKDVAGRTKADCIYAAEASSALFSVADVRSLVDEVLKDDGGWSEEWPTEEGMYWFHGVRWKTWGTDVKETHLCRVVTANNSAGGKSTLYIASGSALSKRDGAEGVFMPAEIPVP